MKDNDIIEKIHKIYDQKEPDVLSRLDFSKVEMKTVPEKSLNKRYFSAAAVYAAVCLVIAIVLPFLIGGRGDEPKPVPSNSDVQTETDVTDDRSIDNTEYNEYNERTTEFETKAQSDGEEKITVTEETSVSGTAASKENVSNDVSPIPAETDKAAKPTPETVAPEKPEPETGKKPSIAEPAVSTSKAPVTTPASVVTAPVTTVPDAGSDIPVFINPPATEDPKAATASTLRFYKDKEMTEEYASAADIPYGAVVYYEVVSDPGYICTRLQMNVYEISRKNDSHNYIQYDNVFVNNYSGDGLEYSTYSALAGDVDENLVYNLKDVVILLRALVSDTGYGVVNSFNGTWGDYDCNGRCNLADVAGVLKEAAKWDMDRNRPCPNTFDIVCLLPIDKTDIYRDVLIDYNKLDSSYIVVDNTTEANRYSIPQEWIEKYDDPFYEKYSLVAFNVCNSDGSEAKLTKLWYHTSYNYVIPEFENTDVKFGEGYTMCILVDSSIKVYENYPR